MIMLDGCIFELDLVIKMWIKRFELLCRLLGEFEKIKNCIVKGNRLCVVGSVKIFRYIFLFVVYLK